MWALDHKEGWVLKNWCFWTVVSKTLDSSVDCKQIKPVDPKGNQPWIFIGRTDAEAPILWSPGVRNWLISKDPDAEKDWKQEEKGTTEDKIVGSCHQLNRHEFASSVRWCRTGKTGVLHPRGSQRVGCDWATEQRVPLKMRYMNVIIMHWHPSPKEDYILQRYTGNVYIITFIKCKMLYMSNSKIFTLKVNPYTNSLSFLYMRA